VSAVFFCALGPARSGGLHFFRNQRTRPEAKTAPGRSRRRNRAPQLLSTGRSRPQTSGPVLHSSDREHWTAGSRLRHPPLPQGRSASLLDPGTSGRQLPSSALASTSRATAVNGRQRPPPLRGRASLPPASPSASDRTQPQDRRRRGFETRRKDCWRARGGLKAAFRPRIRVDRIDPGCHKHIEPELCSGRYLHSERILFCVSSSM